jgi:hypothetical protein
MMRLAGHRNQGSTPTFWEAAAYSAEGAGVGRQMFTRLRTRSIRNAAAVGRRLTREMRRGLESWARWPEVLLRSYGSVWRCDANTGMTAGAFLASRYLAEYI